MGREKVSYVLFFYFSSINVLRKLQKHLSSLSGTRLHRNLLKLLVCFVVHMANYQYFDEGVFTYGHIMNSFVVMFV